LDKYGIAQILREMSMAIELIDETPAKAIAYHKAAQIIEQIDDLNDYLQSHTLTSLPGIGEKIGRMIALLANDQMVAYHLSLMSKVPPGLWLLTKLPGLSLKRLRLLYEQLGIENLEDLKAALESGKIKALKGFGNWYAKKIEQSLLFMQKNFSLPYRQAERSATALCEILQQHCNIIISGSLRRKVELISAITLVAYPNNQDACQLHLSSHPIVEEINTRKNNSLSFTLKNGLKVTIYFINQKDLPVALLQTTGNVKHLKDLKKIAINKGYKLSRYQLKNYQGLIASEQDLYRQLNLPYIYPELREGYGEIEAAKKGEFSNLIHFQDLRGTFHCHTHASDGLNSIEEMALAARSLGWEYIGISDHSKSSYQAHGLNEERIYEQIQSIRALNQKNLPIYILAGCECDILKDGTLDYDEEILKQLDFVIISIHRYFNLDKKTMTKRLIKAIENPYTTIIGHLTGRLLRYRSPYSLDIPKIIDACIANQKVIELNSSPSRLDMDWRYWIKAHDRGLKCAINPDAHSIHELEYCRFGVDIARKGWLRRQDVINTLPLSDLAAFLNKSIQ
jgi:DNA polymerase (family X)